MLPVVGCVLVALTLLLFIKCSTRVAWHECLRQVEIAAATTAANTTVARTPAANTTETSFNESSSPMKNFTKWTTTLQCRRPGLRIFYFVDTVPKNVKKRAWLRRTIGDPQIENFLNSSIVFFVGVAPDPNERRLVEEEAAQEGDVQKSKVPG
ncbi:hypothetical protein V5799_005891 [Amblyomma americanum]|uniref:Secreted protein n=1 Tax=Amblyomma americanum TaxID=6943 RepID=A0AAQ4DXY5_AMBAM